MNHLPDLIRDLGLILIVAGITSLIFKRLKQPVVLGYILAGLLVSPNISLLPTVTDSTDISIWAEIGVIFLLFALGLEFSFKKLMRIGGPASVTAITEVALTLLVGFGIGQVLGWSLMDCIFLGGILSISSTTIILRAFDELGVKNKKFAQLVFGVLIIEDLVAVVLMVLLSTIAVSREFAGTEMLLSVGKLIFYLLLWFVAGIFFIPSFLRKASKLLNDETILIISLGLCLLMVILASKAGFSPALGAFIMGSILAETTQAERIEHIVKPVKDLFGAVFFVSVGMLIDPKILLEYALPIGIITVVFVCLKTLNVTFGAMISGQPLKTALHAGMSQAQIGEFSFIIATLGVSLKVTSNFLYPIAVAVSALTTFTTPYMIKQAGPFYNWIEKRLPAKWKKTLARYSTGAQTITTASDWQLVIRTFLLHIVLFSIIIIGVILLFSVYAAPVIIDKFKDPFAGNCITALLCLIVISPFLWAMVTRNLQQDAVANLWGNKLYRSLLIFLRIVRSSLAIVYIGVFLLSFFSLIIAFWGFIVLILVALIFSRRITSFYVRLENRFFNNFNDREREAAKRSRHELAPWDAHITQFKILSGSSAVGIALEDLGLREKLGINIAMIRRGDFNMPAPARNEKLYPGDIVFVIGTDEQLEHFKNYILPQSGMPAEQSGSREVVLKKLRLKENASVVGKTIRESAIRERTNGLVVGIERNGRRILNPESALVLENDDLLWIVGDGVLINGLKEELQ